MDLSFINLPCKWLSTDDRCDKRLEFKKKLLESVYTWYFPFISNTLCTLCGDCEEAVFISSAGDGGGGGDDETPADGVYEEGLLRAGNPAKGPRACVWTKGSVRVIWKIYERCVWQRCFNFPHAVYIFFLQRDDYILHHCANGSAV